MTHRTLTLFAAALFAAVISTPARAQEAQPAQPAQSPAASPSSSPSSSPVPTPPASAPAQSAAQNSAPGDASSAQQAKPAVKRVWTDDDMGDLRENSSISTVGNAHGNAGSSKPGAKTANSNAPRSKTAQYYHDQIVRLQGQIPPIDQKISDLQAAIEGKPVSGARTFGGVRPDDWKDEVQRLQKQRDDITAKIATLQDQARHQGVPENQIP
jgi:hypothetical protein